MLKTVEEVVDGVGGAMAAASLARVGASAVSMWKARGKIPAEQYMVLAEALRGFGKEADPDLFGFTAPEEARP